MVDIDLAGIARTARLRAGLSPQDAARAIGCSRPLILAWESGQNQVGAGKYLLAAAKAYQLRPEWLATGEGSDGYPWRGIGIDDSPVSRSAPRAEEDRHPAIRRVTIQGATDMDNAGFWRDGAPEAEGTAYPTDDPDAYAIRIMSQRFHPALSLGQCILVSPAAPVKPGRPVLVTMLDGRRTLRTFVSHEHGMWNLSSVTNANEFLGLSEAEVERVDRVMAYLWTD